MPSVSPDGDVITAEDHTTEESPAPSSDTGAAPSSESPPPNTAPESGEGDMAIQFEFDMKGVVIVLYTNEPRLVSSFCLSVCLFVKLSVCVRPSICLSLCLSSIFMVSVILPWHLKETHPLPEQVISLQLNILVTTIYCALLKLLIFRIAPMLYSTTVGCFVSTNVLHEECHKAG